jgi:glycosyltransferase involved in cell wall biosynthesis
MTDPKPIFPTQRAWIRGLVLGAMGFRLGQFHMYPPRPIIVDAPPCELPIPEPRLRISLVTPVLNQVDFVGQTLESVFAQRYAGLEYIVQDGGSTDGTLAIIEKYADRLAYFRSEKDEGQSDAINRGFANASGDILGWLNADDLMLPGALDCVARFFERHPEVDVVYGDRIVINEQGLEVGRWALSPHADWILSWLDYVPQETLFWRRGLWERVGGHVDPAYQFAMDWDLLVRFRDCGARFAHLSRYLGAFRVHPAQKTSAQMNDLGLPEMTRIRVRCLGHEPSRWEMRWAVWRYALRHLYYYWHHRFFAADS